MISFRLVGRGVHCREPSQIKEGSVNRIIAGKLLLCILILPAIGRATEGQKPQPFSADYKLTSPAGAEVMVGKIYMAWPKVRVDAKDVKHGFTSFTIVDYVAQKAISLLPQSHTYTEITLDKHNQTMQSAPPIGPTFDASKPCAGHDSWSCKKLGPQTIAGRQCDVWDIVMDKNGTVTAWIDPKLNFPIKSKTADGYVLEYTNIQEGQQAAPTLFEVPPGYHRAEAGDRVHH
jgi:hypothetical protein